MDIHKVIGKIPFKPKKGFVLPRHRFTGPYNPLHLQLDSKDNPLPGNEPYNAVDAVDEIIIDNRSLQKKIRELTAENNDLFDLIYDMEIQTNNLKQYTRRENIEISNISKNSSAAFRSIRSESLRVNWNQSSIL